MWNGRNHPVKQLIINPFYTLIISLSLILGSSLVADELDEQAKQDLKKDIKLQDLAYGEILYHYYRGDEISALTRILIANKNNQLPNHSNSAELLSGVIYLNLGMLTKAQGIFNRLLSKEDLKHELIAKIEFYLAKLHYKQGDFEQAKRRLLNIYSVLDTKLADESLIMLSNIDLYDGQLQSARDWLKQISRDSEFLSYSRYNLGILWLKDGKLANALPFLTKVYFTFEPTDVQRSLQDKAKVALGYHYLKSKNFEKARAQFLSVRLKSPYTNKALLGAGWTYIENEQYEKALSHWLELSKKDVRDIAVQEALLAIPYAYQKLEAMDLSLRHYLKASDSYQNQIKIIEKIEKKIEKGKFIKKLLSKLKKANRKNKTNAAVVDSELFGDDYDYYIYELIAKNKFNEDYRSFQKIGQLDLMLEHWEKQLPMFSEMLKANQISFNKKIPKIDAYIDKGLLEKYIINSKQIDNELEQISRSENLHLLATSEQKKLYERISRLEKRLKIIPAEMINAEQLEKVRRAKGVLQWQFEENKADKIWQLRKEKDNLDEMLKTTNKRTAALESARSYALTRFSGYQAKIDEGEARLTELQARISSELDIQSDQITGQILSVLKRRKITLEHFLLQADLAIARLHEQAMKMPEVD